MSYHYKVMRPQLFTEDGVSKLLEVRSQVRKRIAAAGAVKFDSLGGCGDAWLTFAAIDYLVERGELVEVTGPGVAGQNRIFIRGDNWSE